jgi:hypothetical protein
MQEVDRKAAAMMMLDALDIEDYEKQLLIPPVDPNNPPPPAPEVQKILQEVQKIGAEAQFISAQTKDLMINHLANAAELEHKSKDLELKRSIENKKAEEIDSSIKLNHSAAVLNLAKANATEKEANKPPERKSNEQ